MGLCSFPPPTSMNVTAVAQGAMVPGVPAWGYFALLHREASLVLAHGHGKVRAAVRGLPGVLACTLRPRAAGTVCSA